MFKSFIEKSNKITPAETVIKSVCKIKKGERVLIIANPATTEIAQNLYTEALEVGSVPVLMFQSTKTLLDNASEEVVAAIKTEPDVILSISENKLGKDKEAIANPYTNEKGEKFNSTFDYLLSGKKVIRAVWTPGLTVDMFERTVNIDYDTLSENCKKLSEKYVGVESVHVTSAAGTDITVPVKGRKALSDDGDFSKPGTGGNIPAGEVFISPLPGNGKVDNSVSNAISILGKSVTVTTDDENVTGSNGKIVFDGSMTFSDGDGIIKTPITVDVESGIVKNISGGDEAKRLLKSITDAEKASIQMEKDGKLPEGQGAIYKRNARNIGELGIGLNPAATISGNMLEDEKAFRTCHFAIGMNYDGDAPCLIHLDGVVRNPTIVFKYEDGNEVTILKDGEIQF